MCKKNIVNWDKLDGKFSSNAYLNYTNYDNCDITSQLILLLLSGGKHGFEVTAGKAILLIFNTYRNSITDTTYDTVLNTTINKININKFNWHDHVHKNTMPDTENKMDTVSDTEYKADTLSENNYKNMSIIKQISTFCYKKTKLEGLKICISVMVDIPSKHVFPIYYYVNRDTKHVYIALFDSDAKYVDIKKKSHSSRLFTDYFEVEGKSRAFFKLHMNETHVNDDDYLCTICDTDDSHKYINFVCKLLESAYDTVPNNSNDAVFVYMRIQNFNNNISTNNIETYVNSLVQCEDEISIARVF